MPDIYHSIYQKLEKMGIFEVRNCAVWERPPYIPLCIDRLSPDTYALSQNPVIEGEMVADPDMEVRVDHSLRIAEPLSYQDRAGSRKVYTAPGKVDLKTRNDLCVFLDRWLDDLMNQGFIRNQ